MKIQRLKEIIGMRLMAMGGSYFRSAFNIINIVRSFATG
jgi:hypothetical protein